MSIHQLGSPCPWAGERGLRILHVAKIEEFKRERWFENFDVIGLTPHCGTTNGFILLKGERAKLDEPRRTDAFERISMQIGRNMEGYGVVPGVTLEGIPKVQERNPDIFK